MKLILRKNDSATSLLLFIYNIYMSKTQSNCLKLSSLLEIMSCFGKSETAIRMSLSRAVKAGMLINTKQESEIIYSLSYSGKQAIQLWNEGVDSFWKRYMLRNAPWEGKWHILSIKFNDNIKQKRDTLDRLQQLGYRAINTYTWICPYYQKDTVLKLMQKLDSEAEIFEIYGELTIHKGMKRFIDEVFCADSIKPKYEAFIKAYENKLQEIKEAHNKEQFLSEGWALPILHELGWSFFDIASEDATLPKQLIPHWEGDDAAKIMKDFRDILFQSSWEYLERYS